MEHVHEDEQRGECSEREKTLEEENRQLLLSIDKANDESRENQIKLNVLLDENESLKALISVLQNDSSEVEKGTISPKWEGGNYVQELEDKQRKSEDELKWKEEQFEHLQEVHEKLLDQLRESRSEWEIEKSLLVDEISMLNFKLKESLVDRRQATEGLNSEGKIEMECSTTNEEEIVTMRHSLRKKEMECKDLEYNVKQLEKENRELVVSINELQEAHIPKSLATPSTWAKLRSKLQSLEQTRKEKEAEWNTRAEKMTHELNRCNSSLLIKDQVINDLKKELEDCNSSLTQMKMQNEELSLMCQLMRAECSEGSNEQSIDKEGSLINLMGQLEEEREEKLEILNELERYKELLEEATDTEQKLKDELQEVYDTLDNIDSEFTDKTNEASELGLELQSWKSIAERLLMHVEESQETRRELEASLLTQAELEEKLKNDKEEKDKRINNLEEQILLIDEEIRIEEEDVLEEDVKVSQRSQINDEVEVEEMLKQDTRDNDREHILMFDEEIRIEEEDILEEDVKVSQRLQIDDDDDDDDDYVDIEEMLKQDTKENERAKILLFDEKIRIKEEEDDEKDITEEDEKASQRPQLDNDNDDQQQLESLAGELEQAILADTEAERNDTQQVHAEVSFEHNIQEDPSKNQVEVIEGFDHHKEVSIDLEDDDVCAAKEKANDENLHTNKMGEPVIESIM